MMDKTISANIHRNYGKSKNIFDTAVVGGISKILPSGVRK